MSAPNFDYSQLSPAERIELAAQRWDSLEPVPGPVDEALAADLRRRRAALAADGDLGAPAHQVLDEIADRATPVDSCRCVPVRHPGRRP